MENVKKGGRKFEGRACVAGMKIPYCCKKKKTDEIPVKKNKKGGGKKGTIERGGRYRPTTDDGNGPREQREVQLKTDCPTC